MLQEAHMKLRMTQQDFWGKKISPQKLGKWSKSRPKTGFIEFIEKFGY